MSDAPHARFVRLHRQDSPLLLPNVWDAASAALWQQAGAAALGTSSAALAWACGYADGGALPRAPLLHQVAAILRVASVPVSVDLEDGYSDDPGAVAALAAGIAATGAVGINLEDGAGPPERLAAKIRAVRDALGEAPLFVNARTDVYLRGLAAGPAAIDEAVARLARYRDAGADGGFVPGLREPGDIAAIAAAVPMPLNVMAVPGLPPVAALAAAGVRRISAGSALFQHAYGAGRHAAQRFLDGDLAETLRERVDYGELNGLFAG